MTDNSTPIKQIGVCPDGTLEDLEKKIKVRTAQLLETNQRLQREINEKNRAEQINRTLFRISNAVNTSKDLPALYVSIHKALGEIIDLTNFFIALYNKKEQTRVYAYFRDEYDEGQDIKNFSLDGSITGEIIRAGEPLFIDQAGLEARNANKQALGTLSKVFLGVPLKVKGEVIGVMATQSYDDPHHYDEMDLEILNAVSDQVALAIERKQSQDAIKASEEKYRGILANIQDGYFEVDLAGNFTLVNGAMCHILGYSETELMGTNNREYMDGEISRIVFKTFNDVFRSGIPAEILEEVLIHKDKSRRYVETTVSLIRDENDQPVGFRGIARDVTERKTAEIERKDLEDKLAHSQRMEALGTLAGGVAHDFNNLLTGIQGRTSLLLLDLHEQHPDLKHLKSIEECVQNASALTNRLLGFARGGKYEVKPTDLNKLVEKTMMMFGRTRKEIILNTSLQAELRVVEVDANQIEQVLLNLLVNAWQAMPNGGHINIETQNVFLDEEEAYSHGIAGGDYARLIVTDTGEGIKKETLKKVFDPFFTTKSTGHGTGLGLAMAYGIVDNHGGAIFVKSELNQGASFTILLPATNKTIPDDVISQTGIQRGTETILLVDDEEVIIDVSRQLLENLGYTVLTAASGREAIGIYSSQRKSIALVIIDMIMPEISGGELFDRLKAINPDVKALLASGYSISGKAMEILSRGCDGFLQKPFNLSQLSIKIREILAEGK